MRIQSYLIVFNFSVSLLIVSLIVFLSELFISTIIGINHIPMIDMRQNVIIFLSFMSIFINLVSNFVISCLIV